MSFHFKSYIKLYCHFSIFRNFIGFMKTLSNSVYLKLGTKSTLYRCSMAWISNLTLTV